MAGGGTLVIRPEILEELKSRMGMPSQYPLYYVEPVVKQDANTTFNYTTAIFDTVFEVLLDVEIIIAAAEIYIGGSTAFTLFLDEQYFQSGFYTGSSSFGFWYVTRDIWIKWINVWCATYTDYDYPWC